VPPIFDEYAIASLARGDSDAGNIPPPALIGNDQQIRDTLRGLSRLSSASLLPNAGGLSALIGTVLADAAGAEHLADILPQKPEFDPLRSLLQQNPATVPPAAETDSTANAIADRAEELTDLLRSLGYTGLLRAQGGSLVMSSPVNYGLFQRFLAEQDLWSENAAAALEEAGLTSAGYFMQDPLGRPINTDPAEPVRGINALSIFAFMDWLAQYLSDLKIRLPRPSESSAAAISTTDDPAAAASAAGIDRIDSGLWEYTGQYAHRHQSAHAGSAALTVEAEEMRKLQDALSAGRRREATYQIFLNAGIQVQNADDETGILMPTMVSPVAVFRLVFEAQ